MRMILTDINLHRRVIRLVHGSGWVLNDNKWCPATCLTVVNMDRSDFTSIYIERRQGRLKLANNNIYHVPDDDDDDDARITIFLLRS